MYLKEVIKNRKKQIYASRVNTILNLSSFGYDFDDSDKNLAQRPKVIVASKNKKEIVNMVTPIERAFSNLIISIVNNVTYNRYEQILLPKKTSKIV